ncbi:MAG TPA: 3-phosphoserine/phosphohydroxythreonine transaminase [Pyrinomonadaceae bacterium]|nr:3-phosphoserine/phosphohydroxythreonine transaminase [Pyrinomonadaceae bacterium]
MQKRIYNFSAGPATLPVAVLERARDEMMSLGDAAMSVMEMSHRSAAFGEVLESARSGIRGLLEVPSNYQILFLQGGATLQFAMVPMSFLASGEKADYVITGAWGEKVLREARRFGTAVAGFSSAASGFRSIPEVDALTFTPDARYIHYTSNETIHGVEFKYDLDGGPIPVVCDASSNILSKPIDIEKYALVYAGAQKNIGPSGVTLVIIRVDLLDRARDGLPSMLDYRLYAEHGSMLNTPNTWGIYMTHLVCEWLRDQGGLEIMRTKNEEKAAILYDAIDRSEGFYRGHAKRDARSAMNVTFRLPSQELEKQFVNEARKLDMDGLAGHRSVGGIRASIYNAFPLEGVEALVDFMRLFAAANGRPIMKN